MLHLGTRSSGALDGVRWMVRLGDLMGLFQTKLFYNSIYLFISADSIACSEQYRSSQDVRAIKVVSVLTEEENLVKRELGLPLNWTKSSSL